MSLNINIFKMILQIFLVIILLIFILTTNIKLVVNSMDFYNYEFEKYSISKKTGIDQKELISVAKQIVNYFNNDEKEINVSIWNNNKKVENLFNSKEVLHMVDVKVLIRLVYILQSISLGFIVVYLLLGIYRLKKNFVFNLSKLLFRSSVTIILIIFLIGFISLTGFEKAFLIFHQISFANDLWQLDPRKDYLIAIFPQGFFYEATILIGLLTLFEASCILILSKLFQRISLKN